MKNNNLNKYELKNKVMKDLFIFLSQSPHIKNINFKKVNNISQFEKSKCINLSKNLSKYLTKNNITEISSKTILPIIKRHVQHSRVYEKNIELIKLYTILFHEKNCSHLTYYLYNNSNFGIITEDKKCLSIVIERFPKFCLILNEHLDIFTAKHIKERKGKVFLYKDKELFITKIKHKTYLFLFSIIIGYLLIYNIPNNYIIMEMNLTMHMKMNHTGHIISYRPKTKSAKVMIKQNKQLRRSIHHSIPSFINYGLQNNILKPGSKVNIYVIGPPIRKKFFENLKNSLEDVPVEIIINNSGNLIKINRT